MKKTPAVPAGYSFVKIVSSLRAFRRARFGARTNGIVLPRRLKGDFNALARCLLREKNSLKNSGGAFDVSAPLLKRLSEKMPGPARQAAAQVLRDMRALPDGDATLRLIPARGYTVGRRKDTSVYAFHEDTSGNLRGRTLCCYNGPATEGLREDEVLLSEPGGDGQTVYIPVKTARPFSFGIGHLWRMATLGADARIPPLKHRAPAARRGGTPRLVLVAD